MFLEQYAGELIAFFTGIAGVIIGKVTNRKREKVDVQELEVRITDKLLKIIMGDIVEPLREELADSREELKLLNNAFKKRHICRSNLSCPISVELQKQQDSFKQRKRRKQTTDRQHKSVYREDNETGNDPECEDTDEDIPGQTG